MKKWRGVVSTTFTFFCLQVLLFTAVAEEPAVYEVSIPYQGISTEFDFSDTDLSGISKGEGGKPSPKIDWSQFETAPATEYAKKTLQNEEKTTPILTDNIHLAQGAGMLLIASVMLAILLPFLLSVPHKGFQRLMVLPAIGGLILGVFLFEEMADPGHYSNKDTMKAFYCSVIGSLTLMGLYNLGYRASSWIKEGFHDEKSS